jgi:hypothetical protein
MVRKKKGGVQATEGSVEAFDKDMYLEGRIAASRSSDRGHVLRGLYRRVKRNVAVLAIASITVSDAFLLPTICHMPSACFCICTSVSRAHPSPQECDARNACNKLLY